MSKGTIRQFPIYAEGAAGYADAASIEPIANGENVDATVLGRPAENLRERDEVIRGLFEDLFYLADADRALIVAGPGTVTWPGSVTDGSTGIFTLSDTLYVIPALTLGEEQTPPVPPVASFPGILALDRASDSAAAIAVTSALRNYQGGDKTNITVVSGSVYSCVLADETTMSIVITATASTDLTTVINSLNALLNGNGDPVVTAALDGGALGTDLIERPQGPRRMTYNHDGEGHAITPAQLAAFFVDPNNALREGDSLCIQYSTLIDESPATDGGRRQAIPENANTSVPAASLFNSRQNPDRLTNAIPICKVVNGRLCFISGQQVPPGAVGFDLGSGYASAATNDMMRNVVVSGFGQGAHAGLTFATALGVYWLNGQRISKAADTVALADASTNYVYLDTDGDLKATTTLSTGVALTRLVLYVAVTSGGAITTVTDVRRYLSRYNSRSFVTVGGINCDFPTLESAYAWTGLMSSAGEDTYFEIVVQGDVTMAGTIVIDHRLTLRQNMVNGGHINTPSGAFAFTMASGTVARVEFRDVWFAIPTAAGSGLLEVSGTATANDWTFDNCNIVGGRDEHTISVVGNSNAMSNWRITNNRFSGMAHTSAYFSVALEQMTGAVIADNVITGGTGDAFDGGIVLAYGPKGNVIENNNVTSGGIHFAVLTDNIAVTLSATAEGNKIANNRSSSARGNAVQCDEFTVVQGNFFDDGNSAGASTNGVVAVFGDGCVVNDNVFINWNGAAVELNTSMGVEVSSNVMSTNVAGALYGVYDNGGSPNARVCNNLIDLSVGAAAGSGKALGEAIVLSGTSPNCIVANNTIRNTGSGASPSAGVIQTDDYTAIVGNTLVNCRGTAATYGAQCTLVGNSSDNTGIPFNYVVTYGKTVQTDRLDFTPAAITTYNDYDIGNVSRIYIDGTAGGASFGGWANPEDGREVEVWVYGASFNFNNEGGGSVAANRFRTPGGVTLTVGVGECAFVRYDGTLSRWRVHS